MNPLQKHFLRRIAALRGARNLAVQMRTVSASALRAPLALNRAALAAVLTDIPLTGTLHPQLATLASSAGLVMLISLF